MLVPLSELLTTICLQTIRTALGSDGQAELAEAVWEYSRPEFVSMLEQGGQLLQREVPRPCHVCGHGEYQPESFANSFRLLGAAFLSTPDVEASHGFMNFVVEDKQLVFKPCFLIWDWNFHLSTMVGPAGGVRL
jgi:hypothetical protein